MRVVQAFRREGTNYRQFLAVNGAYREANEQTVERERDLLPVRQPAVGDGDGGRARLRRRAGAGRQVTAGALFVFIGLLTNFFDPVQQLSQFYQTFLAGDGGAGQDLRRDGHGAGRWWTSRRRCRCRRSPGDVRFEDVHFAYREDTAEVLHGISFTVASRARRWRWSATPAPASRHRQAARPLLRPHRRPRSPSTATTCATSPGARCARSSASCRRRLPVRRQHPRQHRLRPPRRSDRGGGGGGRGGRRRRVHPGAAGRLRHRDRRSAAAGSRSASGSWWRSRGRCSPTPGC